MAVGRALAPSVFENRLMAGARIADAEELAARLGYEFKTSQLLQDALTHPSLAGFRQRKKGPMPYERLEFLGDRVLGLVIAEWLYEKYPDASEGEMAKRHAALVNREALRVVAIEIGLGHYLRLARGEEASGERKNLATLPDAMEALLGALYLDGGLKAAGAFIHRYWQKEIAIEEAPADPKTSLQEWVQAQGLPLPQYKVVSHSGPAHAPKFVIEVSVKGHAPAVAEGNSKREAQKAAAEKLLKQVKPSK
jgi:ribonuclease-3